MNSSMLCRICLEREIYVNLNLSPQLWPSSSAKLKVANLGSAIITKKRNHLMIIICSLISRTAILGFKSRPNKT